MKNQALEKKRTEFNLVMGERTLPGKIQSGPKHDWTRTPLDVARDITSNKEAARRELLLHMEIPEELWETPRPVPYQIVWRKPNEKDLVISKSPDELRAQIVRGRKLQRNLHLLEARADAIITDVRWEDGVIFFIDPNQKTCHRSCVQISQICTPRTISHDAAWEVMLEILREDEVAGLEELFPKPSKRDL